MYRPKDNFHVPMELLVPTWITVSGVRKKTYPSTGDIINGSFKTYGGNMIMEKEKNGILAIEDTATVETWYRPDIKSDCRIKLASGAIYEIINEPENIEMRNQFMKFKVKRVKGGA